MYSKNLPTTVVWKQQRKKIKNADKIDIQLTLDNSNSHGTLKKVV